MIESNEIQTTKTGLHKFIKWTVVLYVIAYVSLLILKYVTPIQERPFTNMPAFFFDIFAAFFLPLSGLLVVIFSMLVMVRVSQISNKLVNLVLAGLLLLMGAFNIYFFFNPSGIPLF